MADIQILSKEISELIAAGEVIERPSSVIKELIENSVDAGAKHITVEIKNGGKTFMRISDDGYGIAENQVETAFLRHATSKIATKDDLEKIYTLGFRGEALASVAAVSKIDMLTKQANEEYGTHYVSEGGIELIFEKMGCNNGTTITVRDLFFNVPARQKFLKKDVAEGNSISLIVNKIALSHPEISFKFIRDGKIEINSAGDGEIYSAIYAVYGKTFANDMLEVNYDENNIKVTGYIVKPLYSKANRSFQNFFVNNRYIKSNICAVAIEEAYKGIIMTGKFPACVLNIELSPTITDVNVHPAKAEVRFSDDKLIFNAIYFAIKNAFMQNNMIYEFQFNSRTIESKPTIEEKDKSIQDLVEENSAENKPPIQIRFPENDNKQNVNNDNLDLLTSEITNTKGNLFENDVLIQRIKNAENIENAEIPSNSLKEFQYINSSSFENKKDTEKDINPYYIEEKPEIKVIGEIFYNYIIAEIEDTMVMIDKHAAHEKIIYEKLRKQTEKIESQLLMNMSGIILSENEFQALQENTQILDNMGFRFDFSQKPYVIPTDIPIFLNDSNIDEIVPELAENIYLNKINPQTHRLDDMFHSLACKAAIKANDKNDIKELQVLAEQVYFNEDIRHCPHGRPVMFILSKKDMEKQFKRIQ